MRRIVSVFVLAVVAALFSVVAPPQATAGAVISGQLVEGGDPVPGTTMRLYLDDSGAPGKLVDTASTDATGHFVLSPTIDAPHWVEVVRNSRVQGGFVRDQADGPSSVEFDFDFATPVTPGTDLGRVRGLLPFISGVVVNAANGNRLRGIRVSTRDPVHVGTVLGTDTTDVNGFFKIPVTGDEFALRVRGRERGFENGWVGSGLGVVPTFGAAGTFAPGRLGKIRLDRL